MQGLINNQRFPKLARGTLPNETAHSVLNAKGVGKGWKSYDLLKVRAILGVMELWTGGAFRLLPTALLCLL
jgi:hypothetical protein